MGQKLILGCRFLDSFHENLTNSLHLPPGNKRRRAAVTARAKETLLLQIRLKSYSHPSEAFWSKGSQQKSACGITELGKTSWLKKVSCSYNNSVAEW